MKDIYTRLWNSGIYLWVLAPYVFEKARREPYWAIESTGLDTWSMTVDDRYCGTLQIIHEGYDSKLLINYRNNHLAVPSILMTDYMENYVRRVIEIESIVYLIAKNKSNRKRIIKEHILKFKLFFYDIAEVEQWMDSND